VVNTTPTLAEFPFPGKHSNERFQFCFRQHWIRLLWPFTKLLIINVILILSGIFLFRSGIANEEVLRRTVLIIGSVFFLVAHFEFLIRFYRYFLYIVIVTDKKIHRIKKTLITVDDHISMDIWMLQDIQKSQYGIIQNVLGFGSFILEAQETTLRIHFIPDISAKYASLMHLREQARALMSYPVPQGS
jgi:hypothetical protein